MFWTRQGESVVVYTKLMKRFFFHLTFGCCNKNGSERGKETHNGNGFTIIIF